MPLPEKVLNQLSHEAPETPGWSFNLIGFSGGVFFLTVLIYCGLIFGYGPYLDSQISETTDQMNALAKSIPTDAKASFTTFYSQTANLKTALASHVIPSQFFAWLEKHTEAHVSYVRANLATGSGELSLSATAPTDADMNQQLTIFEHAPEVKRMNVMGISYSDTTNQWQFTVSLSLNTAAVLRRAP
jgi:hypothetical protein